MGERARGDEGVTRELEGARRALRQHRLLGRQPAALEPHLEILHVPALARIVGEQAAQRLEHGSR